MTPNGGTATATSMPVTNSGNGGGVNGVTTISSSSSSSTTPEKSPPFTAAPSSSQKIIQTTTTATTNTTQQISSSSSLTTPTIHTASNNPTKKPPRNKGGGGSRNNNNNNNNSNANKQSASSTRSGATAGDGNTKPNRPKSSKSTKSSTPSAAYLETHNLVLPPDSSLHTIATKSPALLHPQITLTCYIPTNSVGAVIGRRGSTVLQIQKHAQSHSCHASGGGPVRVSIVGHTDTTSTDPTTTTTTTANPMQQEQQQQPQSHNPTIEQHAEEGSTTSTQQHGGSGASVPYTYSPLDMSSPHWTPVIIRADPCAALAAAQRLEQMVGEFDEVVVDLPISRTRHAALVGKRGFILANLSADTHVRIMVPRRDLRHDVIQLEGELHHVHTCLERVLTLAMESSSPTTNTTNTPSSNTAGGGKKKKDKHADSAPPLMGGNLPHSESKSMSLHISPPQTKLRSIGRKTDTLIKRKRVGDEEWVVTVSGNNADQVLAAIHLLEKWKEDASMTGGQPPPFTGGGGRGGGGRSKRGGYNNSSSKRKNTNNNNGNRNNNNNNTATTYQEHDQQ